jgi:hypothetical protein
MLKKLGFFQGTGGIGRTPIWTKQAKEVVAAAVQSERVKSAIDKCLIQVTSGKAAGKIIMMQGGQS